MTSTIAIFGGGPAGLMAATHLSGHGHAVTVYDAMPTLGRKFLLAGKSGLNLTHSEDYARFRARFGTASDTLAEALDDLKPDALRAWADALGAETFTGTSGRVFPRAMKGSPLLRRWLSDLQEKGVTIRTRHRWLGFEGQAHRVDTPDGMKIIHADAALLAFGGGSWPRLGSDGGWIEPLRQAQIAIDDLQPANCGFDVPWSPLFREKFAGAPVKSVTATSGADAIPGEFVISRTGIEGSLVYAHSATLRDRLRAEGQAFLLLDLVPGRTLTRLEQDLSRQNPGTSFSNRLRKGAALDGVKTALLRECVADCASLAPKELARAIKALPIPLAAPRPLAEAISSAGGVRWTEMDRTYQLKRHPGLFVAGEMIDWEAPTGGYLLTACMATGKAAAKGMLAYLAAAKG